MATEESKLKGARGGEAEADQRGTAPLSRKRAHQQLAGRRHSPPLTVANYLINPPNITYNRYSTESQALQAKTPLGSAPKAVWLSVGAPVVDKKGKGALRVLDALTLDTDTLDRRARPSTRAPHSPATADP